MIRIRVRRLIEKLLSVKFVIFIATTVLRCAGVIGCAEWLTVAMAVIAGREVQKVVGSKSLNFSTREKEDEETLGSN